MLHHAPFDHVRSMRYLDHPVQVVRRDARTFQAEDHAAHLASVQFGVRSNVVEIVLCGKAVG